MIVHASSFHTSRCQIISQKSRPRKTCRRICAQLSTPLKCCPHYRQSHAILYLSLPLRSPCLHQASVDAVLTACAGRGRLRRFRGWLLPPLARRVSYRSSTSSRTWLTRRPIFGSPSSSEAPSFQLCVVQVPVAMPQPFQDVAV